MLPLTALAAGGIVLFFWGNRVLSQFVLDLVSRSSGGRAEIGEVSASLLSGVTLKDLRFYEDLPDGTRQVVGTVSEIRLIFNLLRSMMLRHRTVNLEVHEPRLSIDLERPLFDPFMLREVDAFLARQNISVDASASGGSLTLTGLRYRPEGFQASFEGDMVLRPGIAAQYGLKLKDERTAYNLKGALDLRELTTEATFDLLSQHLVVSPLSWRDWTYKTNLQFVGKLSAQLFREAPATPRPEGHRVTELAPGRWISLGWSSQVRALAGVIECAPRKIRRLGVQVTGHVDPSGLVVDQAEVPLETGKLTLNARVPELDPTRAKVEIVFEAIPLEAYRDLVGPGPDGVLSGKIQREGTGPVTFVVDVEQPRGTIFRFDHARIAGNYAGDVVQITNVTARAGQGEAKASGRADLAANHYSFYARFRDFPHWTFQEFLAKFTVEGGLFDGTLTGSGSMDPLSFEKWRYRFDVETPRLAGHDFDQGQVFGRYDRGVSDIESLDLVKPSLFQAARYRSHSDSRGVRHGISVKGLDLGPLTAQSLRGKATFEGEMAGAPGATRPQIKGVLEGLAVGAGGTPAASPIAVELKPGADATSYALRLEDPRMGSVELSARLKAGEWPPKRETLGLTPVRGQFQIRDLAALKTWSKQEVSWLRGGTVRGTFEAPRGLEGARELKVALGSSELLTTIGTVQTQGCRLEVGPDRTIVERTLFEIEGGQATVEGGLRGENLGLAVSLKDVPVIVPLSDSPDREPAHGRVSGDFRVDGTSADPRLDGQFHVTRLDLGPEARQLFPEARMRGRIHYSSGVMDVKDGQLTAGPVQVSVSGRVPMALPGSTAAGSTAPMQLDINMPATDARFLKVLAPTMIETVDGVVQARVAVMGSPDAPKIRGELDLTARRLGAPFLPGELNNFHLSVVQTDRAVVLKELSGFMMGGRLSGRGLLPLQANTPGATGPVSMRVELDGFGLERDGVTLEGIGGYLNLSGHMEKPHLEGRFEVERGQIKANGGSSDWGFLEKFRESVKGSRLANMEVDLAAQVPQNMWIRSDHMEAELKGQIKLTGPLDRVHMGGELDTQRGSMYIQGRKLQVTQGVIKFDRPTRENHFEFTLLDSPNLRVPRDAPYVKFTGETVVDTVRVFVDIKGYPIADGINTTLRSLPPLEESELVTLLATGTRSTSANMGQQVPDLLGFSIASQMQSTIVDRNVEGLVQRYFALDNFRLNSNLFKIGNNQNAMDPSVTMGKYLTDSVYVAADSSLGTDALFNRVEMQLRLQPNTALTVERTMGNNVVGGGAFDRPYSTAPENRIGVVQSLRW